MTLDYCRLLKAYRSRRVLGRRLFGAITEDAGP